MNKQKIKELKAKKREIGKNQKELSKEYDKLAFTYLKLNAKIENLKSKTSVNINLGHCHDYTS